MPTPGIQSKAIIRHKEHNLNGSPLQCRFNRNLPSRFSPRSSGFKTLVHSINQTLPTDERRFFGKSHIEETRTHNKDKPTVNQPRFCPLNPRLPASQATLRQNTRHPNAPARSGKSVVNCPGFDRKPPCLNPCYASFGLWTHRERRIFRNVQSPEFPAFPPIFADAKPAASVSCESHKSLRISNLLFRFTVLPKSRKLPSMVIPNPKNLTPPILLCRRKRRI
jgi:hypothetical protein